MVEFRIVFTANRWQVSTYVDGAPEGFNSFHDTVPMCNYMDNFMKERV